MKRFSIDQKILEALLNYVVTKPYNEVAQLIAAVQQDIKPTEDESIADVPHNEVRAFPQVEPPTEVVK